MEQGSPPHSLATSERRVSSPSAANTGARGCRFAIGRLWSLRDMGLDVLHLLSPAPVVAPERFKAPLAGNAFEAGLGEQKQSTVRRGLKPELHQRRGFSRIVKRRVDRIRMPGERKEPLGLHFLNDGFPLEVLIARISDVAARDLTRDKRAVQLHTKPFPKLTVISEGPPYPRNRRLELDMFLYLVGHLIPATS